MAHTRINPDGVMTVPGLTQVTVASGSRHIHISGQVPANADGELQHVGNLQGQFEVTFRNLVTCLEAAGATMDDVVKMTMYVVDYEPSDISALVGALGEVFGDDQPAPTSTLLGVQGLFMEGQRVEIDAHAILD
jgi:enamine deaminase RidA (YjgF/YER057c/UK114 family)